EGAESGADGGVCAESGTGAEPGADGIWTRRESTEPGPDGGVCAGEGEESESGTDGVWTAASQESESGRYERIRSTTEPRRIASGVSAAAAAAVLPADGPWERCL
ncbi:hypothetical protein V496_06584, partial [Pseudogymnoascus sp. VKM F-4515 (FW-2607)]